MARLLISRDASEHRQHVLIAVKVDVAVHQRIVVTIQSVLIVLLDVVTGTQAGVDVVNAWVLASPNVLPASIAPLA